MDDDQALESWPNLNRVVGGSDESRCLRLLELAKSRGVSVTYLLRIHSRLNRLRAERERAELRELAHHG